MVWGAIAHGCKGPLIKLNIEEETEGDAIAKGKKKGRGLNGAKYVSQVLHGPLGKFCKEVKMQTGCEMLVVEDGAPGHTSKVAKQARAELGIKTLTHLWISILSSHYGIYSKPTLLTFQGLAILLTIFGWLHSEFGMS
jgi:hypothetical protein